MIWREGKLHLQNGIFSLDFVSIEIKIHTTPYFSDECHHIPPIFLWVLYNTFNWSSIQFIVINNDSHQCSPILFQLAHVFIHGLMSLTCNLREFAWASCVVGGNKIVKEARSAEPSSQWRPHKRWTRSETIQLWCVLRAPLWWDEVRISRLIWVILKDNRDWIDSKLPINWWQCSTRERDWGGQKINKTIISAKREKAKSGRWVRTRKLGVVNWDGLTKVAGVVMGIGAGNGSW